MSVETISNSQTKLTPAEEVLQSLWEEHMAAEFATCDTEAALALPRWFPMPTSTTFP